MTKLKLSNKIQPYGQSRETYDLEFENKKWKIDNDRILGWLRKEKEKADRTTKAISNWGLGD